MAAALQLLEQHNGDVKAAARAAGVSLAVFESRIKRARDNLRAAAQEAEIDELHPDNQMANDKMHRLQRENTRLKAELKTERDNRLEAEDIRAKVYGLADIDPNPPGWALAPTRPTKQVRQTPILFSSDRQFGEVVVPSEVNFFNEYNVEIAIARHKRLIQTTLDLCFHHEADPNYDGIYYLRGGDEISGAIHQELAETDEVSQIPAIQMLMDVDAEAIATLRKHFGKVYVVSVPGNHGRTTFKPRAKHYADLNYESHLAWMLQREFRRDKNIRFLSPASGDAFFQVYDRNYLLTHGDRIGSRGGQGFIGPQATILRGMRKTRAQYAAQGKHIDTILTGHFHTSCDLGIGFGNGAAIGYNEYAHMLRCDPEPPQQYLLMAHPRRGITHNWKIQLDDRRPPVAAERMEDAA